MARGTEIDECKARKQTPCSQSCFTPLAEVNSCCPVKSIKRGDAAALPVPVMALSDPNLEEEKELEPGQSDEYGTSLLEHLESPEAELDAVPAPSVIGESGHPDRELPAFTKAEDDRLQTGSGDEKQQISSVKEQLLLYC